MRDNLLVTTNRLFRYLCILFMFYLIIYPLQINFMFRIIMFLIYLVVLGMAYFFYSKPIKLKNFICQSVCITLVVCEFLVSGKPWTLDNIQSVMCFVFLVVLVGAEENFTLGRSEHIFLQQTATLASVIMIIYSLLPFGYYYRGTTRRCIYLTLNLDNSNFAGIVLYLLFTILWVERRFVVTTLKKVIRYGICAYLVYMIYLTNSRTCLGAALVLIGYTLFFSHKRIPQWIVVSTEFLPFVFPPLYLWLSRVSGGAGEFLGKEVFSGRERVYSMYLGKLKDFWDVLFGNMEELFFVNAGNGPLAIFCTCGVVCLVFFYVLYLGKVFKYNRQSSSVTSRSAIIALCAIAIHSCGESSLFLGGIPSLYFQFTLLCLARTKESDFFLEGE